MMSVSWDDAAGLHKVECDFWVKAYRSVLSHQCAKAKRGLSKQCCCAINQRWIRAESQEMNQVIARMPHVACECECPVGQHLLAQEVDLSSPGSAPGRRWHRPGGYLTLLCGGTRAQGFCRTASACLTSVPNQQSYDNSENRCACCPTRAARSAPSKSITTKVCIRMNRGFWEAFG